MGGTDKGRTRRQAEFGDRVRARRQELGWSQERLALKAGINRTYIASLESGARNPSLELIARLAAAMKVDAGELVRGLERVRGR
jgi:transcriptional regulator with XRE-family HTH domain